MEKLTLKKLNEINNKFHNNPDIRQLYEYNNVTKAWKFCGYKCIKCDRVFTKEGYIRQHKDKCPKGRIIKDDIQGVVMTVDRKIWHPLDINQKLTSGQT